MLTSSDSVIHDCVNIIFRDGSLMFEFDVFVERGVRVCWFE
jgi:hypothetical protein